MAVQHIGYTTSSPKGDKLRVMLLHGEDFIDQLNDLVGSMQLMIDGDGSQAAHFAYMTTEFGFDSDTVAKAAWEELLSVQGKLNTDASVSNVKAALIQAFNKFR